MEWPKCDKCDKQATSCAWDRKDVTHKYEDGFKHFEAVPNSKRLGCDDHPVYPGVVYEQI